MVPIEKQAPSTEGETTRVTDLDQLIAEIGTRTKDDIGAVETVREIRRDL